MELYRLLEEYDQLHVQLHTVITKVEELLEEADQPNEPQALGDLKEQKDTREKLIIQMENVKRKMETEQKQMEGKKEIEEVKKFMSQIHVEGKAANVLLKVDEVKNNLITLLEQMGPEQFNAELNQLKEELGKKKMLGLIIKQITQKEMRKKTLQQVGTQFEETEIKQEVTQQITDNEKLKELLEQVLDDRIHRIQQLSTEEFKKLKYKETHKQLIVTELIQELITKIIPEIHVHVQQAWQEHKDEIWIQDKVEEEIKKPIMLGRQPLKTIHDIGQTRELVKKFVEGFLEFITEQQNEDMVKDTTKKITDVMCSTKSIKQQKFRLQQIQERMQQIKEIKEEAKEIQSEARKKEVALDSLQQKAKQVEQQAQQKEWDEYYMMIACLAALRSKDPKTPVSLVQHIGIIIHVHYNRLVLALLTIKHIK